MGFSGPSYARGFALAVFALGVNARAFRRNGGCITDTLKAERKAMDLEIGPNAYYFDQRIDSRALPDLNGDGVADQALTSPVECVSGGCRYSVYLSSGSGCFVPGGHVDGVAQEPPAVLDTTHHGVRDLRGFHSVGCAQKEGSVSYFEFDGRLYAENKSRQVECACPAGSGETSTPRSPDCPPVN